MAKHYTHPKHVPHPDEVEEAKERINKTRKQATVEIKFGTHWRKCIATEIKEFPNRIKPELSILFFKPEVIIATPGMHSLNCWVAITLKGAKEGRCTVMKDVGDDPRLSLSRGVIHEFRYPYEETKHFFQQRFAKAAGMRYRSHKLVKPDEYEYTKNP